PLPNGALLVRYSDKVRHPPIRVEIVNLSINDCDRPRDCSLRVPHCPTTRPLAAWEYCHNVTARPHGDSYNCARESKYMASVEIQVIKNYNDKKLNRLDCQWRHRARMCSNSGRAVVPIGNKSSL